MFPYIPPEKPSETATESAANQMTDAAHRFARQRLGDGASPEQIEADLVDAGFGAEAAAQVVKEMEAGQLTPIRRGARRNARWDSQSDTDTESELEIIARAKTVAAKEAGRKMMVFGAFWFIGGSVVTVASLAISSNGGTGIIAWGAIIWGAIQFFRGMNQASGSGPA